MFLLYINDIGEMIDSNTRVKLFADDCLLFRPIREPKDQTQLQEDLNHLKSWADIMADELQSTKMWRYAHNKK